MTYLHELIKQILISITSFITSVNHQSDRKLENQSSTIKFVDDNFIERIIELPSYPKLILKPATQNSNITSLAHRSHRSHSSHRSHYSHYSSRTSTVPSKKSPTIILEEKKYNLGDRTLIKGMKGKDVIELKKILKENHGYTMKSEVYMNQDLFDDYLEMIIKDYQEIINVTVDGKVHTLTLFYLKNKKKLKKDNQENKKEENDILNELVSDYNVRRILRVVKGYIMFKSNYKYNVGDKVLVYRLINNNKSKVGAITIVKIVNEKVAGKIIQEESFNIVVGDIIYEKK
jgi:hypothetical protein